MKEIARHISLLALLASVATGCATAMDMQDTDARITNNEARIERLEKQQTARQSQAAQDTKSRLESMEQEVAELRRQFADTKLSVDGLLEKIESMQAYLDEMDQFIAQFRKKGGEMDRALEDLATKLEAEVRKLGEKVKEMLSEGR